MESLHSKQNKPENLLGEMGDDKVLPQASSGRKRGGQERGEGSNGEGDTGFMLKGCWYLLPASVN